MADYCDGVITILTDASVIGSGWIGCTNKLPTAPDQVIVVTETGGKEPNPKWLIDYPSIQVMVRGAAGDGPGAKAKAREVYDALLGFESADVSGDRWVSIRGIGGINTLGFDENNRPLFTVNFSMIIEPASGSLTNRQSL